MEIEPGSQVSGKEKSQELGKVVVLDEGGRSMRMLLSGVDSSFANAWRRSIMGEVEILAIDRLEIYTNSTMMADDKLLHRLGLVPLQGNVDQYLVRERCDCDDGCLRCMAEFHLDVKNESDEPIAITSNDLIAMQPHFKPISSNITIVKLHKNQHLSFKAFAVKSTSRQENNAKWNPVTIASYRPTANVTVNHDLINRFLNPDEQKRVCAAEPAQVLVYNERLKRIEPHPDAPLRCTYSGDFIETLADILHPPNHAQEKNPQEKDEKGMDRTIMLSDLETENARVMKHPTELVHPMISMIPNNNQFLFPIVSTGCMPPREIAIRALAALRKRLVAIQILISRKHTLNK